MKSSVYIESSVISYLSARPSRDVLVAARQAVTRDWWENHRSRFELRVSQLVESEIRAGDPHAARLRLESLLGIPRLNDSDDARFIARGLLASGAVPHGSADDALHIGIAAAQGVAARCFVRQRNLEVQSMLPDPIVEEIRLIRMAHEAEYENDLYRIVEALREEERASTHVFLNPGPRRLSVPRASEQADSYGTGAADTQVLP